MKLVINNKDYEAKEVPERGLIVMYKLPKKINNLKSKKLHTCIIIDGQKYLIEAKIEGIWLI